MRKKSFLFATSFWNKRKRDKKTFKINVDKREENCRKTGKLKLSWKISFRFFLLFTRLQQCINAKYFSQFFEISSHKLNENLLVCEMNLKRARGWWSERKWTCFVLEDDSFNFLCKSQKVYLQFEESLNETSINFSFTQN